MAAEDFARQLQEDYRSSKLDRARKPRPITTNHPHSAGHPCYRYLILLRVAWRLQAPMMDPVKAALFEEGHHQEQALVTDLRAIGLYLVALQKVPIALPELEIVGEIDFCVRRGNGPGYVADVKAVSPGIFRAIRTADDLVGHRRHWVRQWLVQLLLYIKGLAHMNPVPDWLHLGYALLILKDKTTGDINPVVIPWMQDLYDHTADRLRWINAQVKAIEAVQTTHPTHLFSDDPIWLRSNLPAVLIGSLATDACPGCGFLHFCAGELSMPVDQVAILDDPDLEGFLELREEHRANHLKYEEADADVKGLLHRLKITLGPHGKAYFIVGSFLVTASQAHPKGKTPYFTYDIWRRPEPPSLVIHA